MQANPVTLLDVSAYSYPVRVTAAALQGLLNRSGPVLFLNYGIYDDPLARRTNEVFLDDESWFGSVREAIGNQDLANFKYYQRTHGMEANFSDDLAQVIRENLAVLKGCVVWDESFDDTVNAALMLAAQHDLLVIEKEMLPWAQEFNLPIHSDLCNRWTNRIELYTWASETLLPACTPGLLACIEPGWRRPEFIDYIVQNRIFTYNLSSQHKGWGQVLLLLLSFGPPWLRELIFALRLDGPIRRLGLRLMSNASPEVKLNNHIQSGISADTVPSIFGWHTQRDDELAFMLLLSANGLRLVPSHLAANFSFHARIPALRSSAEASKAFTEAPEIDPQGSYLTFTLSDGDQLMMMSTAELGNWNSPQRGRIAFNWETQPLLAELAPALLEKYRNEATPLDCLIAGPSGAGYIIPPLAPDLPAYLKETSRICRLAGIQVVTSYVADPPRRVLWDLSKFSDGLTGYLSGYAKFSRAPQTLLKNIVFIANQFPHVSHIWDSAEDLLQSVKAMIREPKTERPRFIAVHLFAYRTRYEDVLHWAEALDDPHIHIVRADVFLQLAKKAMRR